MSNTWDSNELLMQRFINDKIQHPFTPFFNANDDNHLRKRELRVTPYLIGWVFRLSASRLFLVQACLLVIFIYLTISLIFDFSQDIPIAFWATIGLLFSYPGQSFTYDTLFYDSFAYLFLLVALYKRTNWFLCSAALLLAYFVDERSVIGSLIIPIFMFLETSYPTLKIQLRQIWQNRELRIGLLTITGTIVVYLVLRLLMKEQFGLVTPVGRKNGVGIGLAFRYGNLLPLAIFSSLKANFFLLVMALVYLIKSKKYNFSLALGLTFLLAILIALSVEDVTRSLAYSFLGVFVVYLLQSKTDKVLAMRYTLMGIALLNICAPTYTLILELKRIEAFYWTLD